jgi:T5SS/PEP-CTERM-associated repeat protein
MMQSFSPKRISRCLLMAVSAVAIQAGSARADRYWITSGGGSFGDTANWSDTNGGGGGFSVPDTTQPTNFQLGSLSPYTVSFGAAAESSTLTVLNNNVTFDLNANDYFVDKTTTGTVTVSATGAGNTSSLSVTDGSLRQTLPGTFNNTLNFLRIRGDDTSSAQMTIDGPTASYTGGQGSIGGTNSNPTASRLTISNGGKVFQTSDTNVNNGSVVITGTNSQMRAYQLGIGGASNATLDITNGGMLTIRTPNDMYTPDILRNGFRGTVTLDNGTIELNGSAGGQMLNHGLLRGSGTIRRFAGATGLSTMFLDSYETGNFSKIRVGDTSATPAVGTLNIQDTNFTSRTNGPAGAQQQIFFDLASPTSFDRIALTNPGGDAAQVTATLAGSILFNNLNTINFTGDTTLDFITAEQILNSGFTTPDLATAAGGWTYNGGATPFTYSLDVVNVGTDDDRLRLTITGLPEPTSLGICGATIGFGMLRRRRSAKI